MGEQDPVAGELVKAFVISVLGTSRAMTYGSTCSAAAAIGLGLSWRNEVVFDQHVPHTTSVMVMRRLPKARELEIHWRRGTFDSGLDWTD